jgi:hypothetical protein
MLMPAIFSRRKSPHRAFIDNAVMRRLGFGFIGKAEIDEG